MKHYILYLLAITTMVIAGVMILMGLIFYNTVLFSFGIGILLLTAFVNSNVLDEYD